MATDVTNSVEDVEMAESEEDKVVTMMDVLQEQEDFEEDANAVLGASDDKNCTYSKGYIKRQALYACMTCCSEAKSDLTKRAGLCLACSLICHENHELVELYTKRNFKCDCGNSKFSSNPCQLTPNKAQINEDNSYNQNFSGLYCVCQRPYPDPENPTEDEMIQCTICEDWLHASHLETTAPPSDQYTEMICKGCMEKNDFLYCYSNLIVNVDNTEVDIINNDEHVLNSSHVCNGDVKCDKIDVKDVKGDSVQSLETKDINIDISEEIPKSSTTNDNIENSQNIKSNSNVSEIITNRDNISCEKGSIESAETSSNLTNISDNNEKVASQIPETEKLENLQDLNKTEDITNIIEDQGHSDNTSEQKINVDLLKEGDKITETKEIVDNKVDVTAQKNETDGDNIVKIEVTKNTSDINITNQNKKDEERIEEDRLLADPESEDSKPKSNLEDDKVETAHTTENASNDDQVSENQGISKPAEKTKNLSLPSNDKNESDDFENKVVYDHPAFPEKASNSGSQEVVNKDLLVENSSIEEKTESKSDNHMANNINPILSKEESDNTEQPISQSYKETNSQDKVSEKRKLSTEENSNSVVVKKTKLEQLDDIKSCICPKNVKKVHKGATFWPLSFRQKLCTCRECLVLYKDLSVLYLIDPEDTVSAYENLGIEKTNGKPSQYEKGLQALSSLDRIQQINALTEYNKMRDKLLDFLKSFKDRKEIVKEEDIKAFFEGMKPTREPDGVYFCR